MNLFQKVTNDQLMDNREDKCQSRMLRSLSEDNKKLRFFCFDGY